MPLKQKLYCRTLGCKMGFAVKGIMQVLRSRFNQEGVELTLEQYFLLNILDNEEKLILQDLAEIVDRDKSAVLRHINALEENHFVVRAADPEDKRRKILLITKLGIRELGKARILDQQVNDQIIHPISKKKLREFEDLLSQIYRKSASIG